MSNLYSLLAHQFYSRGLRWGMEDPVTPRSLFLASIWVLPLNSSPNFQIIMCFNCYFLSAKRLNLTPYSLCNLVLVKKALFLQGNLNGRAALWRKVWEWGMKVWEKMNQKKKIKYKWRYIQLFLNCWIVDSVVISNKFSYPGYNYFFHFIQLSSSSYSLMLMSLSNLSRTISPLDRVIVEFALVVIKILSFITSAFILLNSRISP